MAEIPKVPKAIPLIPKEDYAGEQGVGGEPLQDELEFQPSMGQPPGQPMAPTAPQEQQRQPGMLEQFMGMAQQPQQMPQQMMPQQQQDSMQSAMQQGMPQQQMPMLLGQGGAGTPPQMGAPPGFQPPAPPGQTPGMMLPGGAPQAQQQQQPQLLPPNPGQMGMQGMDQGIMQGLMGQGTRPQPPPPGAQARSRGPIARYRQAMENDPQGMMMMLSALTQAPSDPNIMRQTGMQLKQDREGTALKREQIQAQGQYRSDQMEERRGKQKELEDYRFDKRVDALWGRASGYDADTVAPFGSIDDEPKLREAERNLTGEINKRKSGERWSKYLGETMKGLRTGDIGNTEWADDEGKQREIESVTKQSKIVRDYAAERMDMARKRLAMAKEAHAKIKDDDKRREHLRVQMEKIKEVTNKLSRKQAQFEANRSLDIWGLLDSYANEIDVLEDELTVLYGGARYTAGGKEGYEDIGAGTPRSIYVGREPGDAEALKERTDAAREGRTPGIGSGAGLDLFDTAVGTDEGFKPTTTGEKSMDQQLSDQYLDELD